MEIDMTGNVNVGNFEDAIVDKLDEILTSTAERLEREQGVDITGAVVTRANFTVGFIIEGMEEPQLLTVEHHEGVPEMFKWVVDLEEETEVNNEEKSAYDAWTVAKAKGDELTFETVESEYAIEDLLPTETDGYGNMTRTVNDHTDGFKVVQVTQDGNLIQEYKLVPKDETEEEPVEDTTEKA